MRKICFEDKKWLVRKSVKTITRPHSNFCVLVTAITNEKDNCKFSDLSEVWCLKENDNPILWRVERGMMRAMRGHKIIDKKTEERLNPLPI